MVLSIEARPEHRSVEPNRVASFHVALVLEARGDPVDVRPPLSCVLALDASGSMHGEPLEHAVRSAQLLAELASPTDALGLVIFSDSASEVAPLAPMDEVGKRLFRARTDRILAGGNTNIEHGLRLSAAQLQRTDPRSRRSILLLSDGAPNVGLSSADGLRSLAKSARPHVSISSLGYGAKHDEDVLAAIAAGGGGRYAFVPHPLRCRRELALALGSQADVVVDGIELTVQPAAGVEVLRVVGHSDLRWGNGGLVVPVADMEDGAKQVIPILIRLLGGNLPKGVVLKVRVRRRCARTGEWVEEELEITVDVKSGEPQLDPIVTEHLLLGYGAEARARARALADRGDFAGAAANLRHFIQRFAAVPPACLFPGSALVGMREALVDDIVTYERRPSREAYSNFKRHTIQSNASSLHGGTAGPHSRELGRRTAGFVRPAALLVVSGSWTGRRFTLGDSNAIGRTSRADIVLPSPMVSQRHAEVYAVEGEYWVCDLGSTNATFVNGRRLSSEPHRLASGDVIRVGDVDLRFEISELAPRGLAPSSGQVHP